MSAASQRPLGQPIPDSPHAVSMSLPTLADVVGYEEKRPETLAHLRQGYPRFLRHPWLRQAEEELQVRLGLGGRRLWLASSPKAAASLAAWIGPSAAAHEGPGWAGASHPDTPELFLRAKAYLQHSGASPSSRAAADILGQLGHPPPEHPETRYKGEAAAEVRRTLLPWFEPAAEADLLLANSGMNAFWAAFHALRKLQAERGRHLWVQLGWLYLDTAHVLTKCARSPEEVIVLHDVCGGRGLEELFAARGREIAGVVTEIPTNPLVQSPDLCSLYRQCLEHGARLIADPTLASPVNLSVLSCCDLAVNSLTKYAAGEGDVLAGAVVINPAGPDADALRASVSRELEPVHSADTARLAAQIGGYPALMEAINTTAPEVLAYLLSHPKVSRVHWSRHPSSRVNYDALARSPQATGSMISFSVGGRQELARAYDRMTLAKGPSFGMRTTLISPFMYLAHYDLVSSESGRRQLLGHGIDPDLLRLSIGVEPAAEIIAALAAGLDG